LKFAPIVKIFSAERLTKK